jgi:hypothetical protein
MDSAQRRHRGLRAAIVAITATAALISVGGARAGAAANPTVGPPKLQTIFHGRYAPNWTNLAPVVLDGTTYLFKYNANTGGVAIDLFRPNGHGTVPRWSGWWDPDWTTAMVSNLRGKSYLLTYRTSDGRAALWEFRRGGWGFTRVWATRWRYGWDRITPLFIGNESYLMFYDAIGGVTATTTISATDHGRIHEVWKATTRPNISRFVPFILAGTRYVLTYADRDGSSVITQTDARARGGTKRWHGMQPVDLMALNPFTLNGRRYLLTYSAITGAVMMNEFNAGGAGITQLWRSSWRKGWDRVVTYNLRDKAYVLRYRQSDGGYTIDQALGG